MPLWRVKHTYEIIAKTATEALDTATQKGQLLESEGDIIATDAQVEERRKRENQANAKLWNEAIEAAGGTVHVLCLDAHEYHECPYVDELRSLKRMEDNP